MTATLCRLFRLRLVLANGSAALAGYLLFPARLEPSAVGALLAGVCLLAAAGSALNQVLEREVDALMARTGSRPLPTGELTVVAAVLIAAGCLAGGEALLFAAGGALPALIGAATLLLYLAVYTPLKAVTPFALAIGGLSGAAPPVIGWCTAGGLPADFRIVLLAGIFYLWQVPHFWLLQRRHAEDYRRAGFPLFVPAATGGGPAPLCLLWMAAMLAGALMLPAFGVVGRGAALGCAVPGLLLLLVTGRRSEPALFTGLNLFPVLMTVALCSAR